MQKDCICTHCERPYVYIREVVAAKGINTGNGTTTKLCQRCMVARSRHRLKQKMVDYLGGCCQECGFYKCISALHFHHVDSETKSFTISGSHTRKWSVLEQELDKCDLICANCHAEKHHSCFEC
jgi:hypothetical protein